MTAAATNAAYGISGLTVHPSTWCACSAGDIGVYETQAIRSMRDPIAISECGDSGIPPPEELVGAASRRFEENW
jgi:hypothetical protein